MPRRILIVDDDDDIRDIVQAALEELGGWQTVVATSGREGLHLARTEPVDAILLDVSMPDMDGFQMFTELQRDAATQTIPVLMLTSKVLARDRSRFVDLNIAGVITKPFNPLTLWRQIATLLGWGEA
ncbi:MAG: response regulator [Nodosilinea sp.]